MMMQNLPVTVLVAAKNEGVNIARCLSALSPARRIVVIDSHSEDETGLICRQFGAEVIQFEYRGGYPKKRQWALDHTRIDTPWILLVDADEVIPQELWEEIEEAVGPKPRADAYLITKGFHFLGRRFRFGGFSHSAILLFRRGKARFESLCNAPADSQDMEVHERLLVDGTIARLQTPLIHEDFKGLEAYISRHNLYSTWEARLRFHFLKTGRWGENAVRENLFGNTQERRRFLKRVSMQVPCEPQLWFLYHYLMRLGFLEGRRGLIASRIRGQHFAHVRAKLYELQLHATRPASSPTDQNEILAH
jgi:glycosyltransferase involved in cell wall biosynthesis